MDRVLALQVANPSSIPSTTYGPQVLSRVIPEYKEPGSVWPKNKQISNSETEGSVMRIYLKNNHNIVQ